MNEERDPFLESVLAGEVAPDAEVLQERLARDPQFAERLRESRRTKEMLSAAGKLEREVRQEASELKLPNAEDRIRRLVLERSGRRRPRLLMPAWIAAAAAALVLASVLWKSTSDEANGLDPDATLGTESRSLRPVGAVDAYDAFAWSEDIPGLFFSVVVYDEGGIEIDREENLTTRSWHPTEQRRSTWPDSIRWHVEAASSVTAVPWVSPPVSASRSR